MLLTILFSSSVCAQSISNSSDIKELKDKLLYDFKKYESSTSEDLTLAIEDLNQRMTRYIKFRKQECDGDFSSVELDDQGQERVTNKKLSKIEKKLCMLELINFQKKFVDTIFAVRKKVLIKNHNDQLDTLDKFQRGQIDNLENIASKYK